ncbi:MAG: HD-GYP domain-containing protein [Acidobacteria bacterium OLB17]|nr:MAG: HD-GYP domain-containing protein [Acidobacteria bacterium OLB17]MCZ2389877.1 hypothetical protein [Acidobacteriota bacterium]
MTANPTFHGWLAFEQNVLHRMNFESAALPASADTGLSLYLKRRRIRVAANDPLLSEWVAGVGRVQNDDERLSPEDVNLVLEDAYVPGYKLQNPSLLDHFSEVDAWWFDNVRRNVEKLDSAFKRSLAGTLAIATGNYALSFTEQTRELRQPLSNAYRRLWSIEPDPIKGHSTCSNKPIDQFLADPTTVERANGLMFLRLPAPHSKGLRQALGLKAWREEWIRSDSAFWGTLEASIGDNLGAATETRSQYLRLLENTLDRAGYMKKWAIAFVETGFLSTQDIVNTVAEFRRVETVYTKDLSELTGAKAVIVAA